MSSDKRCCQSAHLTSGSLGSHLPGYIKGLDFVGSSNPAADCLRGASRSGLRPFHTCCFLPRPTPRRDLLGWWNTLFLILPNSGNQHGWKELWENLDHLTSRNEPRPHPPQWLRGASPRPPRPPLCSRCLPRARLLPVPPRSRGAAALVMGGRPAQSRPAHSLNAWHIASTRPAPRGAEHPGPGASPGL